MKKKTIDEFKIQANLKHNNKYKYDDVIYVNNTSKVNIFCTYHGHFLQSPKNHLKGKGCPKCYFDKIRYTICEFKEKANRVHDNIYIYDNINYINWKTKINIICDQHGTFIQTPDAHLQGKGCPKCKKSKSERKIENILKSNNIKYITEYSFNDLKDKGLLRFDFAVYDKENNLYCLIEFNGKQHYKFENQFNKNYEEFLSSLRRDIMKQNYCLKNNLKINIIKYDQNIDSEMLNIISPLLIF